MTSIYDPGVRLWLEIAEDGSKEWGRALEIFAESFADSTPYKRSHPDPVKRKKALEHYFRYLYDTKWSNGRGRLVCLKMKNTKDNAKEKIVYANCIELPGEHSEGDVTAMRGVDEVGFKLLFEQERWEEENIHKPMEKAAQELGTSLIYAAYHAVARDFMNQGIGHKYAIKALQMNYMSAVEQLGIKERLSCKTLQPPIVYGLLDDIRTRNFQKDTLFLELGHLHLNQAPGLKCVDDVDYREGDEVACIFVSVLNFHLRDFAIPVVKKQFVASSRL